MHTYQITANGAAWKFTLESTHESDADPDHIATVWHAARLCGPAKQPKKPDTKKIAALILEDHTQSAPLAQALAPTLQRDLLEPPKDLMLPDFIINRWLNARAPTNTH